MGKLPSSRDCRRPNFRQPEEAEEKKIDEEEGKVEGSDSRTSQTVD